MHIGQTVCSRLPLRVTPADKQAPPLLGALLGTFSGSICCVSPVWDGLPATALLALQQELGFSTAQHAGLNPISFRLAMLIHALREHHPSAVSYKFLAVICCCLLKAVSFSHSQRHHAHTTCLVQEKTCSDTQGVGRRPAI